MAENNFAVALDMLVQSDAGLGLGQDRRERGLADLKRIAPQVVAVQLNQIEGIEEYAIVRTVVPNEIERGNAVAIAGERFAIDDAGAGAQTGERVNDQQKAMGKIVARTAIEPHPRSHWLPAGVGLCRKARCDEPGRGYAATWWAR